MLPPSEFEFSSAAVIKLSEKPQFERGRVYLISNSRPQSQSLQGSAGKLEQQGLETAGPTMSSGKSRNTQCFLARFQLSYLV